MSKPCPCFQSSTLFYTGWKDSVSCLTFAVISCYASNCVLTLQTNICDQTVYKGHTQAERSADVQHTLTLRTSRTSQSSCSVLAMAFKMLAPLALAASAAAMPTDNSMSWEGIPVADGPCLGTIVHIHVCNLPSQLLRLELALRSNPKWTYAVLYRLRC